MKRLLTRWCLWCLLAAAAVLGTVVMLRKPSQVEEDLPIQLRDITSETGIDFRHTDGSGGNRYIVETVASDMATFDYDDDGLIDIYFLNGQPLRGTKANRAAATQRMVTPHKIAAAAMAARRATIDSYSTTITGKIKLPEPAT